jgi:uncharacterized PurR-regulated membrane protein YhhQ (DUF165 family)
MPATTIIAFLIYPFALIAANLLVNEFGPWISPINSFLLIGLDLSLRDWLHLRMSRKAMFMLILFSAITSYFINPSSMMIAIASSTSFLISGLVDYYVFTKAKGKWIVRSNKSNFFGAITDSVLFPTIAFGVLMPEIIVLQSLSKITGGFVFSLILSKFNTSRITNESL